MVYFIQEVLTGSVMKLIEKKISIDLRSKGYSINDICEKTGFAKGSVSSWVRNVILTSEQRQLLSKKGQKLDIIEKRRITRLANENLKKSKAIELAGKDIGSISKRELFLIGIALYWAEGRKAKGGIVSFSNGDPRTIKLMMSFFRDICSVSDSKFRGHIHIHPHLDSSESEKYWSRVSSIPLNQFYKTYCKPNKSSQSKKDSLPYGTFDIYICDTSLFLKISGWIQGICQNLPCTSQAD
jgi:hypothetical protein